MAKVRDRAEMVETAEPAWVDWLERWDRMQEGFSPERERRFQAMFDLLAAQLPSRFTALDLGCGPGSTSDRLLERFPRARSVAVDFDPVVLRVGRGALGDREGRLTWVEADLRDPGWTKRVPRLRYDAAVSTTALHWLDPPGLKRLYRGLHRLLRPGGVFLNGDVMPYGSRSPTLSELARKVRVVRFGKGPRRAQGDAWTRWWNDLRREGALRPEFDERDRRFPRTHHDERPPTVDAHRAALRSAGFRMSAVVWQDLENRVLLGRA